LPLSRAVAQSGKARVLKYVPRADLTVIDPVMITAYITRYHSTAVCDQLQGIDSKLKPQPQMVDGHTVEDDSKLWTVTLRDGLRFHDKEPVRGHDCARSPGATKGRGGATGQGVRAGALPPDRPVLPTHCLLEGHHRHHSRGVRFLERQKDIRWPSLPGSRGQPLEERNVRGHRA
jgi:hypothetical protein